MLKFSSAIGRQKLAQCQYKNHFFISFGRQKFVDESYVTFVGPNRS
jgi:hypothetical protein